MTDTTIDPRPSARSHPRIDVLGRLRAFAVARPELIALLGLAALLNLWALDRNGMANSYYAAAVQSMTESWHAFLYGSFDTEGVMTVDKPPLALWIQALSARAFGLNSWSILVPQALMGVAAVGLTYDLTRRVFGRAAGVTAGAALALTPVAVAVFRHNNPDALLVLCSVAALWFMVRALQDGRTRWLVLSGVAIGLGFETKMAAALLIVPALAAAYLWVAPTGRLPALRQLLAGAAAMVAVGLAWPVLVWLTPEGSRPWVSGTSDNSIWSLILGYNGLGRLFGQSGGPGGGAGAGGGGMGGVFGGDPGPLRLFNQALGGQAAWLIGTAIVGAVGIAVVSRLRRTDARTGWIIATAGSFLVIAVAFSRAEGIFHPYYVSLLAPFTAALAGAVVGVVVRGGREARIIGPAAIVAGVVTTWMTISDSATDLQWWTPLLVLVGGGAAIALALELSDDLRNLALIIGMTVLLLGPATWAFATLGHATSGTFPAGGPESASTMGGPGGGPGGGMSMGGMGGPPGMTAPSGAAGAFAPPGVSGSTGSTSGTPGGIGGGGGFGGGDQSIDEAVGWIQLNGGGTLAVSSQSGASQSVLSGDDVVAIGGFSGRESEVTVDWLASRVDSGEIRWVLATSGGQGMADDGRTGSDDVMSVVSQVCAPASDTSADAPSSLYDCSGYADALTAAAGS